MSILLQAANALRSNSDCLLYLVNEDSEDRDGIWVWEAWTSAEAHQASLEPEEVRTIISKARPLIAEMTQRAELKLAGGKGLGEITETGD